MKPQPDDSICSFVSTKGTRCQRVASNSKSRFCFFHERIRGNYDSDAAASISAQLLAGAPHLKSSADVRVALANLFQMISNREIPAAKGAQLAHIGVSLLHFYESCEAQDAHTQSLQLPKLVLSWKAAFAPNSILEEIAPDDSPSLLGENNLESTTEHS